MNAFGEALNLVFMPTLDALVPIPLPMDSISDCIPMSSYLPAHESQTASHEFLFDAYGFKTQTAFHEFLFPANFL